LLLNCLIGFLNLVDVTRNDCYVDGLICSTEKASGRRLDGIRVGTGCFGDSGGPLMVQRGGNYILLGTVRSGDLSLDSPFLRQCECGCQYKNVFVDVRKHMKWITETLEKEGAARICSREMA